MSNLENKKLSLTHGCTTNQLSTKLNDGLTVSQLNKSIRGLNTKQLSGKLPPIKKK